MSEQVEHVQAWAVWWLPAGKPMPVLLCAVGGVPRSVRKAEVLDALSTWREWPSRIAGLGAGRAGVKVSRNWTAADAAAVDRLPDSAVVPWPAVRPARRRITFDLTSDEHAAAIRHAAAVGVPLNQFCADAVRGRLQGPSLERGTE